MKALRHYALWMAMPVLLLVGCGGGDGAQETAPADTAMASEPMNMGNDAEEVELDATLTGAAEVPGPGDEDGSGEAEIELSIADGTVCFDIEVENIAEAQAAHIHSGAEGESGPPVVNFDVGTNGLEGCVEVDAATIQSIRDSPSNYYVNVHNADFGAGAVRGQLREDM